MLTVTFCGNTYICATALKGPDYVHLVDDAGIMIAAFEGVSDFSGFAIAGGSWTTPKSTDECPVVLMREDGSTCACDTKMGQLLTASKPFTGNVILTDGIQYGTELPTTGTTGQLFFKLN